MSIKSFKFASSKCSLNFFILIYWGVDAFGSEHTELYFYNFSGGTNWWGFALALKYELVLVPNPRSTVILDLFNFLLDYCSYPPVSFVPCTGFQLWPYSFIGVGLIQNGGINCFGVCSCSYYSSLWDSGAWGVALPTERQLNRFLMAFINRSLALFPMNFLSHLGDSSVFIGAVDFDLPPDRLSSVEGAWVCVDGVLANDFRFLVICCYCPLVASCD